VFLSLWCEESLEVCSDKIRSQEQQRITREGDVGLFSSLSSSNRSGGIVVASSLFTLTAYWIIQDLRKRHLTETPSLLSMGRHRERVPRAEERQQHDDEVIVSKRGLAALKPPILYLKQFLACSKNPCDPIHNRSGYIPLCMAENRLIIDLLSQRCL
jgi:hypothetical protein